MDAILLERTIQFTRKVPPDFVSRPYAVVRLQCPFCGVEFGVADGSIQSRWMLCGNYDCEQEIRLPESKSLAEEKPFTTTDTKLCFYDPS